MEHSHYTLRNEAITQILHYREIHTETKVGVAAEFCSPQNETEDWAVTEELELLTELDNLISKVDFYPKESDRFLLRRKGLPLSPTG